MQAEAPHGIAKELEREVEAVSWRLATRGFTYFVSGAIFYTLIQFLNNIDLLMKLQRLHSVHSYHYYLAVKSSVADSDLFVISTALIVVVAAINIGVAVMPQQDTPIIDISRFEARSRARELVWYRSLAASVHLISLTAISCAVLCLVSDPVQKVWLRSIVLGLLAAITVWIGLNVRTVADEEAEKLLKILGLVKTHDKLERGIRQTAALWANSAAAGARVARIKTHRVQNLFGLLLTGLSLFIGNYLFIWIFALCNGAAVSDLVYGKDQLVIVSLSFSLSLLGAYISSLFLFPCFLLFKSNVRHGSMISMKQMSRARKNPDELGTYSRNDQLVQRVRWLAVAVPVLCLTGLALSPVRLNGDSVAVSIWVLVTWVLIPSWLCWAATARGRGPLAFVCRRFVLRRAKELPTLRKTVHSEFVTFVEDSMTDARRRSRNHSVGIHQSSRSAVDAGPNDDAIE